MPSSPTGPRRQDRNDRRHRRPALVALGAAAVGGAVAVGAVAYRRTTRPDTDNAGPSEGLDERSEIGWGQLTPPDPITIPTPDGARLAVWDMGSGPTVVLPHCWGCTHAIWIPVARRLVESGHRVVLYDQRGHGASTRGTAPLDLVTLAHDLTAVLEDREVTDAVLAGHSMGGMTIMALTAHRPEVLARRCSAIVLVATAAADTSLGSPRVDRLAVRLIGSPYVSKTLQSTNGHRFVRGAFGTEPVGSHMDLTRTLFADCDPSVRAGFLSSMSVMDLLDGIATIAVPTTVVIGSRDRLTPPARSQTLIDTIPGARRVTLPERGHMLPLEDPDAVADEIIRAVKG
jgi:pimeloyl-ACP methyl ester carboxylesterase